MSELLEVVEVLELYISELYVKDFRQLKDITINLGRNITIISGQNMTGKSTILAMLGHSCQFRKGNKKASKPILQSNFICEWSEIIKTSSTDIKSPNIATIKYCNDDHSIYKNLHFRTTWQDQNTRWRMIPKYDNSSSSSKMEWPTLYLGLSRLFPVGESTNISTSPRTLQEWAQHMKDAYNEILSIDASDISSIDGITLSDVSRKKGVGVSTSAYSSAVNSAGQDNIGQIIAAVLSFKKLRIYLDNEWKGGLLLIDELDATLHPIAQRKLFKYLLNFSKDYNVQVVFTTHSLSLLEYAESRYLHNSESSVSNSIELSYLTDANGPVQVHRNFPYLGISNDLLSTTSVASFSKNKVTVYCEDDEARWFFLKLYPEAELRVSLPGIKMGCNNLLDLLKHDYPFFSTHVFLLDGDVDDKDIRDAERQASVGVFKNLIKLPSSNMSVEALLFNYIKNLPDAHEIFTDKWLAYHGFSRRTICDIDLSGSDKKIRETYKQWFADNKLFLDKLIDYWLIQNKPVINAFKNEFSRVFNFSARLKGISSMLDSGQNTN